jgi:hypothetical protein
MKNVYLNGENTNQNAQIVRHRLKLEKNLIKNKKIVIFEIYISQNVY